MSTTIAHPRTVPSGPSGKVIAGFVAAAIAVLGVGFGIVNLVVDPVPVDVSPSLNQVGAELAAKQAAVKAETERMLAINEIWNEPSTLAGSDLVEAASLQAALAETDRMLAINENWYDLAQKAAEFASLQAAVARTERMLEINELGYGASIPGGATEEARRRGERMFEINSFGWEPTKLESGGPKSPLTVE